MPLILVYAMLKVVPRCLDSVVFLLFQLLPMLERDRGVVIGSLIAFVTSL